MTDKLNTTSSDAQHLAQINVLTLGVKNDGTEDISEAVNCATEKYALYFPAGRYKVSKPLYLKNPICGVGYSRIPIVTDTHTWFVSEIKCDDGSVGVLNFGDMSVARNIEQLNIMCHSNECGIRIVNEGKEWYASPTNTWIEKVAIYNVRSYGMFLYAGGSRSFFVENATVWGARDFASPCEGIHVEKSSDNRFSNIEVMGCQISMSLNDGYYYGSNLHLWTGCMPWHDNGSWWRGTRGLVLSNAFFNGSQVYPDTSFYALEGKDDWCSFHIKNIFYWEDDSTGGSPDFDGAFFHGKGICMIDGGEIHVAEKGEKSGRMKNVRIPCAGVKNVVIRTDISVCPENIDRLCAGNELPDYMLEYTEKGFCKVADIVLAEPSGCTDSILSLDNGEAYKIRVFRKAGSAAQVEVENMNPLCREGRVQVKEMSPDVFSVFVQNDSDDIMKIRFRTETMGERFRPLHFGLIRKGNNAERDKLVLTEL